MKIWTTNILSSLQQRSPSQESDCTSLLGKLGIMKLYSTVSTLFTFSVGCFLMFLLYVHFTSLNVHIHLSSHDVGSLQSKEHGQIVNDFVKNLNASIRRMDFDQEYTLRNLSQANDGEMNLNVQAGDEEDEGQNPLFLDVMKIARLTAKRKGLPDATDPHDLSGYVSILHPGQIQIDLHCNTCSLVSSSGHLLHSKLGTTIDSTDCVFRMNDAPSRGYSKDVGARTSLRMVGFQAIPKVLKKKEFLLLGSTRPRYLVMWGPEKELSSNGTGSGYNYLKALAMQLEQQGTECFMLSNEEMKFNDKIYEAETGQDRSKSGSWLTTGWFTMILARSVCSEIHVYGMVGENYCKHDHGNKHPYHYYNPHSQDECEYYQSMERAYHGGHRFMTEKAIFASWAKLTPKIYFHQPEWD